MIEKIINRSYKEVIAVVIIMALVEAILSSYPSDTFTDRFINRLFWVATSVIASIALAIYVEEKSKE